MSRDRGREVESEGLTNFLGDRSFDWQPQIAAVAQRFSKEYRGESFELPPEVEAMPIFRDWTGGSLTSRVASPFWEIAQPHKNQTCLDLGCGVSFLIYPWRDWQALFYGQDISIVARDTLVSRGPQLNSKLFKSMQLGAAHQLDEYEANQFDLAIATGVSCYYAIDYWRLVLSAVKRVLKPDGVFVFDVIDPDAEIAENWAILETYLGADVYLESLNNWQTMIKASGAKIVKQMPGELFHLYKVKFS